MADVSDPVKPASSHEMEALRADAAKFAAETAEARKEAATYRTRLRELEKAGEEKAAAALSEQGKYREAFEAATKRLAELETSAKEAEELREWRKSHVARAEKDLAMRIEKLPETLRGLVPASLGLEERIEFVAKLEVLAASSGAGGTRPSGSNSGAHQSQTSPSAAPPLVGSSGPGVPAFGTEREFQDWYRALSPADKAATDAQIRRQSLGNALVHPLSRRG